VIVLSYYTSNFGSNRVHSKVTTTFVAVPLVFFVSGITLPYSLFHAFLNTPFFLIYIQCFNFFCIPCLVIYPITEFLLHFQLLSLELAHGMIMCATLPLTINMVIVFTKSANGDEASAVFSATASTFLGIFITPAMIFLLLRKRTQLSQSITHTIIKLLLTVILPLFIGYCIAQIPIKYFIREESPSNGPSSEQEQEEIESEDETQRQSVEDDSERDDEQKVSEGGDDGSESGAISEKVIGDVVPRELCKLISELSLLFIIYAAFCRLFENARTTSVFAETKPILIVNMVIIQFFGLVFVMIVAWLSLNLIFGNSHNKKLIVMGFFGCTQKTLALGLPLMNAVVGHNPHLGLYTLPLIVWHFFQIVLGSALIPILAKWIAASESE